MDEQAAINFAPVFQGVIKVLTEKGLLVEVAQAKAFEIVDELALFADQQFEKKTA